MRAVTAWIVTAIVMGAVTREVDAQTPYRVPEAPAFAWLSATPTLVSHPTTARAFAASLATLVDSAGRFRQGFALEGAPWAWIPGMSIPISEYGRTRRYVLANTTLSLATLGGEGPDGDADLALGLRTTFFDRADPMRDPEFQGTLRAVQAECGADPDLARRRVLECAEAGTELAREEWLADRWNASSLSAAVVTGLRFDDSRIGNGRWSGWGAWVSGALGVGTAGQLIVQAGYEQRVTPGSNEQNALSAGSRLLVGSSTVNGFLEVAVDENLQGPATDDTTAQWTGGIELRAAPNLWLSTGFGSGFATDAADRVVIVANLRWRIADGPTLGPD